MRCRKCAGLWAAAAAPAAGPPGLEDEGVAMWEIS
jgi:hypothetical protein